MSRARRSGAVAAATYFVISDRPKIRRRYWVWSLLKRRTTYSLESFLADLRKDDVDPVTEEVRENGWFKNFIRISAEDFEKLVEAITPYVKKQDTPFRKAISVTEQLAVTLRFLASGDSYASLSYLTKISNSSISEIVPRINYI